ncbi:MAG: hypothetical protein KME19_08980 [Microcoleus vaginatus WJT46-NPBG5]|jgi:hypothetical protein|nr:hypothetical protein [Microcoleus vaginatus WJT46-NPBG5]MBW4680234.1 hypothetical protein [Microcoleus vaginatus WJT46-NPBG5]
MDTPAALTDMLPGFAVYHRVDVGRLFWRRQDAGYPEDVADMSRRLIAERYTILTTRAADGIVYNLFLRMPAPDAAPAI